MNRLQCTAIIVLLFLSGGTPLWSNGETPRVINFEKFVKEAQNQNWSITQSEDGIVYAANSAGLLEYNGVEWILHPLPQKQIVRSVVCDREGRIFTGGFAEFGYWLRHPNGQLEYHSLNDSISSHKFEGEENWQILEANDGIYFQSFSALYKYNYDKVVQLTPPGNIMFLQKVDGRLYLPVIGQGLYELLPDGSFTMIEGSAFLGDLKIKAILSQQDGLIIGTDQNGLFKYQNGQFTPWDIPINSLLKKQQLNRAIKLSNGWLAFGTILNGLYLLSANGELLFHLDQSNGLQNNTILSLFEDQSQNLWVGLDKGIDLLVLGEPLTYFQDKNGQTGTIYTATIHNKQFYIGTNQGVFSKPWPNRSQYPFQLLEGTQGQVWQLQVFDDQLICGHNEGTFLIEGNSINKISSITGGWSAIPIPGHPDLLIQGTYTGLAILKKQAGQWQLSHRVQGLTSPIRKLVWDKQGKVWAASPYQGLFSIVLNEDLTEAVEVKTFTEKDGLPTTFRIELQEFDQQVLIQADNQFFTWDATTNSFNKLTHIKGLALRNHPFEIMYGRGNEWFASYPQHISWFRDSFHLATFPLSLIPGNENIIPIDSNIYLFCLNDGYALFDHRSNFPQKDFPPPIITSLEIWDREHQFISLEDPILVPPGQKNLRLRFTIPQFTETFRMRFRLEGFSSNWSAWSSRSFAEFTNLPPGQYQFSVQSDLSPTITSLSFTIEPQWYETKLARFFYIALFFLAILFLVRWHRYRMDRQRRKLEIQRERELQQQRISARNEQLKTDVISKSRELASSTFNLIRKNEILMQIKEQLQEIKVKVGKDLPHSYYKKINTLIDNHLTSEHDWEIFETNFNQVHDEFFRKLKQEFPDLTPGDLQLAAYLKMNLSTKEIAPLLNISIRGVENKRYRLRKKMGLPPEVNLTEFMIEF